MTRTRATVLGCQPGSGAARAYAARGRGPDGAADERPVHQLLGRYLEQFAGGENTLELYRGHVRNQISPLIGHLKVGPLTPETLRSSA